MDKGREKKYTQLGIDPSTAANRLRKEILFKYVKRAGENFCYQCGAEIVDIQDFSIEHRIPWIDSDDPNKTFFDLDNIGFSHLSCNVAAKRYRTVRHPSETSYRNGCRCKECKEAHSKKIKRQRKNRYP